MLERSQSFQQAADLHRRGRLAAAEEVYARLLREQPDDFDVLHCLGILRYQQKRLAEALSLIAAALRLNPSFPLALLNHGLVLDALGRRAEALASYDRALALQPDYGEALYNRGIVLRRLDRPGEALAAFGQALSVKPDYAEALYNRACLLRELARPGEALADFDRALALKPNEAELHNHRGLALMDLGRLNEALAAFDRAVGLRPDYAVALNNRANALQDLQRPDEALASYDLALAARPDYVEALYNRGGALRALRRPAEALASYEAALAIKPDHVDALNNSGVVLRELQRPAEALASYDRALALRGDHTEALYNRGAALRDLQRPADALASYDAALAVKPDHVDALNNRGLTLVELRRADEAIASYDRALALRPDFPEAHWNRGWAQLLLGDFDRGWPDLEWRWRVGDVAPWRRNFAQPLWLGETPLMGKSILLHGEQGFGDDLQFVRYVPRVAESAGEVILEVPAALTGLLSRLPGPASIIPRGAELPAFDCQCPLASLPLAFKTRLDTIPVITPYLCPNEDRLIKWKERLPSAATRRVGIAWAGSPKFRGDRTRSIGLARLVPLLAVPGIAFLGLQKDLRPGDREALRDHPQLTYLGDAIEDFEDTAAIISLLDLVISSDTSVVHLAGALGKPVWILLQYAADWRWLLGRSDSPWYPTARLFRQSRPGDWSSVIEAVKAELARG